MFIPLQDLIVLKPLRNEKLEKAESVTGFVRPTNDDNERPERGEIVAVGKEVQSGLLLPGWSVIFRKYSTDEIEYEGEQYLVVREKDIIGVIDFTAGKLSTTDDAVDF